MRIIPQYQTACLWLLVLVLAIIGGCFAPPAGMTDSRIDSDGDGFTDFVERNSATGSDPFDPADTPENPIDSDGDGCSDFDERTFPDFCDNDPNTPGGGTADPENSNTFALSIARHVDLDFSETQADAKLNEASRLLQTVETDCFDVATNVTFQRNGSIETFTTADTIVTSESQLDALFGLPQDIKVVDAMIGVCGIPTTDNISIILGCATTAGSLVIIRDADPDVWAHEWGHVQGLGHRDNCPRNLMHSFEVLTNAVNELERNAFLTPTPGTTRPAGGSNSKAITIATESRALGTDRWADVLPDVLHRSYRTGVPADLLSAVGSDAAPTLRAMFHENALSATTPNVVRAMGFTKNSSLCSDLMAYVGTSAGELTGAEFATVAESLLALGRLTDADPTDSAIEFLINGTFPQAWADRVEWAYRGYDGPRLHVLLARLSILGLSLSDSERARNHLYSLRDGLLTHGDANELSDQVLEAIQRIDGAVPENLKRRSVRIP